MKYFLMIFVFSLWSSLSADPQSDAYNRQYEDQRQTQAIYNQQYENQRLENARQTQALYNQQYQNQLQARKQDNARYEARRLANNRR